MHYAELPSLFDALQLGTPFIGARRLGRRLVRRRFDHGFDAEFLVRHLAVAIDLESHAGAVFAGIVAGFLFSGPA